MSQLYDQLKIDITKTDTANIEDNSFIDLKNKLKICKNSLVAYYQAEYIDSCTNDCRKGTSCKTTCESEAKSAHRWFNDL